MGREYKFGFNEDIGTTEESVWDVGGLYSYLSAASTLKISSSDAADDAAGTGARTVQLYGLDGNHMPINEILTMDGQTAAETTAEFLRIFRLVVRSAGSGVKNAGTVYAGTGTLTAGVPANKYAAISPGQNQTLMCIWTVPAGQRAYVRNIFVSSHSGSNAYATMRLVARPPGEVFQVKEKVVIFRNAFSIPHLVETEYGEKTDLEMRAVASSGTLDASASIAVELKNW